MLKFLKDITTQKDNETFDVGRAYITLMMCMTPLVTVWGCVLESLHAATIINGQFDMNGFFQAIATLWLGIGAFMLSSSYSLKLKASTENVTQPDGTTTIMKTEQTNITTKAS